MGSSVRLTLGLALAMRGSGPWLECGPDQSQGMSRCNKGIDAVLWKSVSIHHQIYVIRDVLIDHRYGEIASLTVEKCVLHITDLTTLDQLLNGDDKSPSGSLIDSLPKTSFSHVRKLNLTFRLTLQDYKMIELQARQPISLDHLTNKPPAALWMDIWAGIAKLKHLQSLHLYLDHDSQASWTLVNEAAILTPLLALSQNPNLRTNISIPALPPQDTQTNTPPLSLSPLNIKRFTRQRFFTEQRQDGTYGIVYEDDANSMFHDPGPSADELARTAEMTMHAWLHGIELDYLAMDEDMGGGC